MDYDNKLQEPRIEKTVVNICVGESGERLGKAENLLKLLTDRKPVRTVSKHKIPAWGIRNGEPIGCKVTLRKDKAIDVVKRVLSARENKLSASCFDKNGNVSFGVAEYIDIDGLKYDPEIGIMGMNLTVILARAGNRIKHRKINVKKIPDSKRIGQDESIDFFKKTFGVEVE